MHNSATSKLFSRWVNAACVLLTAVSLSLAGCGGGSSTLGSSDGQVVVSLTDASGDFLAYSVDVVSLTLTKQGGTVVSALPQTTRVDFTQLADLSELLTGASVPAGNYTSVVMTLDYSNADIEVDDGTGQAVQATVKDRSGNPVTTLDVSLDFDSVAKAGSMLGSAGVIVMDDSTCMVRAITRITRFYAEESCGQCTQCREGTEWMYQILKRIENGKGRKGELEVLLDICKNMLARTICPLSDAAAMPVESYIRKFYDEFDAHIREQRCTVA